MSVEIRIPSVGESISEVVIAQWIVADGEFVEKDAPLLELETDKINQEVPSPAEGIVKHQAAEGDTLAIGDLVGTIEPGAQKATKSPASKKEKPLPKEAKKPELKQQKETVKEVVPVAKEISNATTVARKMAEEHQVDLSRVIGQGQGGRITREDVLDYIVNHQPTRQTQPSSIVAPVNNISTPERATRRERVSQLRKQIAIRLVEAQHTAAMLTTFNEVDMSAVMKLRKDFKEPFEKRHDVGLGFMSFFVKAAVCALQEFQRANAYFQGEEIVYHNYCDIGVAVGTERGLVVPVIRNAEKLSFAGIEQTIRDYAQKAKTGGLTLDNLKGGTFTISNGGVYGSMMSTPILNPPQSAILGMHRIIDRPIAVEGQVVIRPMMYLALSYDHRIVDGKEAVGFLVRIKQALESPSRMLLDV